MQHSRFRPFFNRFKRQVFSRLILARGLFLGLGLVVLAGIVFTTARVYNQVTRYNQGQIESTDNRTNVLILGIGGGSHDSPDLTDSIIVFSIDHTSKKSLLLSIPRDIWLPSLKAKVNSVYHYGQSKQPGGGLVLAKSAISEIIDQPIHYGVVIDFSTFEQVIDLLGGIDLTIDTPFEDNQYPIAGRENDNCNGDPQTRCRYETVKFDQGLLHMSGATALKFVRSRHAQGDEGTDFARSHRQQQVLTAVQAKLLSKAIYTHPDIYNKLYRLLSSSIQTDLPINLYLPALRLGFSARNQKILNAALTQPDQLDHPPISERYANQWVLIPKNNDPHSISSYVQQVFTSPDTP